MKKITTLLVCALWGSIALYAQSNLAQWSSVGETEGFTAVAQWLPNEIAAGMDASTTISLPTVETLKPHGRFAYQPQNDAELNPEHYIRIVLAPEEGRAMALNRLQLNIYSMANGPVAAALRTEVDGFQGSIIRAELKRGSHNTHTVNLTRLGFTRWDKALELRLYLWGAEGLQVGYLSDSRTEPAMRVSGSVVTPR